MIGIYTIAAPSTSAMSQCIFYYRSAYIVDFFLLADFGLQAEQTHKTAASAGLLSFGTAELWNMITHAWPNIHKL